MNSIAIVGGGLFGTVVAIDLAKAGYRVKVFERNPGLLQEASWNNHNRLHFGYHYPRSRDTAQQSFTSALKFAARFPSAVMFGVPNFYAIAKTGSKTSPQDFEAFCTDIGISFERDFPANRLMRANRVEQSYRVPEPMLDLSELKQLILAELKDAAIDVALNSEVLGVKRQDGNTHEVRTQFSREKFDSVVLCTYSRLGNFAGNESRKRLKFQEVLIPEVRLPEEPVGLTIMDGNFCSLMPSGRQRARFLLYHVEASVWPIDAAPGRNFGGKKPLPWAEDVIRQSVEYFPILAKAEITGFRRAFRVVEDSARDQRLSEIALIEPNFFSIFSAKLSSSITIAEDLVTLIADREISGSKTFLRPGPLSAKGE